MIGILSSDYRSHPSLAKMRAYTKENCELRARFDIRTWLGSRGKSRRGERFLLGELGSSYSQQQSPRVICIQSGDGGSGIRGKRDRPVSFPAFLPSFLPSSSSGAERRVSRGGSARRGSLPSGSLFRCRRCVGVPRRENESERRRESSTARCARESTDTLENGKSSQHDGRKVPHGREPSKHC